MFMRKTLLILAVLACLMQCTAQENPTLADVLTERSIALPPEPIPHLNQKITSYGILDDENEFVIGYYLDYANNELRAPLLLTRFDKTSGRWDHREYPESQLKVSDIQDGPDVSCMGSVLHIQRSAAWYFLTLHWNPSAGCFVVLQSDLSVSDARTGGISNTFGSGIAIVDGNMVHFADVHPQTLYLYDPRNRQALPLYPQPHDPFREDFSRRLEAAIVDDRCMKNNWGCQTDRFTTSITSPIDINDETQTIAFRASFETEGFLPREEAEESGAWYDDDYAYIFQLKPFRWREFSIYDLRPKFGTDSLERLTTPDMIGRVFATPTSH
jgi:hypothetical protein